MKKLIFIKTLSKYLFLPLSAIYAAVTSLRNYLYDEKIFKSVRFEVPVIGIGNLSMGGTGKTPHTEYLLLLFQYIIKTATISRGYGRKSTGFKIANEYSTAREIGDEPMQFKRKFPETIVCVSEDRVMAVPRLLTTFPDIDVFILDDAFQHRAIRPGMMILLTNYNDMYTRDNVFPSGHLREAKSNYHRADIIIVSKCPEYLSTSERAAIISEIKPFEYQKVYFSCMKYGTPYSFYKESEKYHLPINSSALLVCGIANPEPLENYLRSKMKSVDVLKFNDHHYYDSLDMETIRRAYTQLPGTDKVIITTEKDAARLKEHQPWFEQNRTIILVQPIAVEFLGSDKINFESDMLRYIEFVKQKSLDSAVKSETA